MKTRPPLNIDEMYPTLNDAAQSSDFALKLIYDANLFINDPTLFENVDVVITSDRQARHLFANSIRELENLGITHANLKQFSHRLPPSEIQFKKQPCELSIPNRRIMILVDAINRGEEINNIVEFVKQNDGVLKSIYAHLINKDTFEKLQNEPNFKDILIKGKHIVPSDEYATIHETFIAFNHSLKDPSDSEHLRAKYLFTPRITKDDTNKMITYVKNHLSKITPFYSIENSLAADSNLHRRFTIGAKNEDNLLIQSIGIDEKIAKIASIEILEIRFYISNEAQKHSHITTTIIPIPDVSFKDILKTKDCANVIDSCSYDKSSISESSTGDYHYIICPQCLENYIATVVHVQVMQFLSDYFDDTKYKCVGSPVIHNPSFAQNEVY